LTFTTITANLKMRARAQLGCALVSVWLGLYLFGRGFLTTRLELPQASLNSTVDPAFDKVVILVIDALRQDFFFAPDHRDAAAEHDVGAAPSNNDLPRLRALINEAVRDGDQFKRRIFGGCASVV
jgi:predicted AlkP superfamily pyrophosphatase or phosphodiesterase